MIWVDLFDYYQKALEKRNLRKSEEKRRDMAEIVRGPAEEGIARRVVH